MKRQRNSEGIDLSVRSAGGVVLALSGEVLIVRAATVKKLNVPAKEVVRVMAAFGSGTSALLAKQAQKPSPD